MKKILIVIIIAISASIAFVLLRNEGSEVSLNQEETESLKLKVGTKVGNIAPDFSLINYEGNKVSLSDFEGTPIFLNFWAAWCPFCIDEMPLMAAIQEEQGDKYLTIAVNRGENLETAREYSDMIGVTGKYTLLLDTGDDLYRTYGGFGMPYSVFIDSGGVIRDIKAGPLTRNELLNKLKKITNL